MKMIVNELTDECCDIDASSSDCANMLFTVENDLLGSTLLDII